MMLGVDDDKHVVIDDDTNKYDNDYVEDGMAPSSPRSIGRKGAIAEQGEFFSLIEYKEQLRVGGHQWWTNTPQGIIIAP